MYAAKQNKEKVCRIIQQYRNTQKFNSHFLENVETKRNCNSFILTNTVQRKVLLTDLLNYLKLTKESTRISEFYHGGHCYFPQKAYNTLKNKFRDDCVTRLSSHYSYVDKKKYPDMQIMVTSNIEGIDSMQKGKEYPFLFGFLPANKRTWGQMEGAPFASITDFIPHALTTLRHYRFGLAPLLGYVNIGPEGYTSEYSEKNKLVLSSLSANKKRRGRLKELRV